MFIDNSATFLHSFFFSADTYSADAIDKKVDSFVIQVCIDKKMIDEVYINGKRMYRILPEGKKAIKRW